MHGFLHSGWNALAIAISLALVTDVMTRTKKGRPNGLPHSLI
jgi:hypothetical protein